MKLILSHPNTDFDGFACMVAAAKLNRGTVMYSPWGLEKGVKRFHTFYKHVFPVKREEREIDFSAVDGLIVVDGRMRAVPPKLKAETEKRDMPVVNFDHHSPELRETAKNERNVTIRYGACTTYFVQELIKSKIEISREEAMLFLLGIHADTGSFTYQSTTPEDLSAAAHLMSYGINMRVFAGFLQAGLESGQVKLFNRLVKNMQLVETGGYKLIITYARFKEHIQQMAEVTSQVMSVNAADGIVAIVQMGNKIFMAGRSNDFKIDIRKALKDFKGGGHASAAAAVMPVKKGVSIKAVKDRVYAAMMENTQERYSVKDIMSSPVRAISPSLTMDEAYKICIRFNNNGLPVVKDGRLEGFITKEDIEKGILHKLGSIPVSGYMSTKVLTVTPDTTIAEAQSIMLKHNIGHLPVLSGEKPVGIVTRTDVLHYLYMEEPLKKERIVFNEQDVNIRAMMAEKLDPAAFSLIRRIGELADEYGVDAYLVGGMVRDMFLGVRDLDIDITVEGDGMEFARFAADKMGGAYKGFERFKTAKVFLKGGSRIDITSARAEFYEFPAALPEIEFTPIRYDLYRRDFTINAMAIQINAKNLGRFIDYFNGFGDLQEGVIRSLYNMTFIDDPTRILRAVRFETRHDFTIEENTMRFITQTLKYNIFETLPGERLADELMILMNEPDPLKPVKRLAQLGVLDKIGGIPLGGETERAFKTAAEKFTSPDFLRAAGNFDRALVYFMLTVKGASEPDVAGLVHKLKFRNEWKKSVLSARHIEERSARVLAAKTVRPSDMHRLLKGVSKEAAAYLMTVLPPGQADKVRSYVAGEKVKAEIRGQDLSALGIKPGPLYSEILREVEHARIDGKVTNKKEEIALAAKIAAARVKGVKHGAHGRHKRQEKRKEIQKKRTGRKKRAGRNR